jgi:hypothetical protein
MKERRNDWRYFRDRSIGNRANKYEHGFSPTFYVLDLSCS